MLNCLTCSKLSYLELCHLNRLVYGTVLFTEQSRRANCPLWQSSLWNCAASRTCLLAPALCGESEDRNAIYRTARSLCRLKPMVNLLQSYSLIERVWNWNPHPKKNLPICAGPCNVKECL